MIDQLPSFAFVCRVFLAIFASYRLARLIARDEGPKIPFSKNEQGVLARLRTRLGAYDYGENGEAQTNIGRWISCPFCVGLYVSAITGTMALVSYFPFPYILPFRVVVTINDVALIVLGIAGAQAWLWSISGETS